MAFDKMSLFAFDPELEQQLNDIDEFIREECGNDLSFGLNQSESLLLSESGKAPPQLNFSSWEVTGRSSDFILVRCE